MKTYKDFTSDQIEREYVNTLDSGAVVAKRLGISFRTFSRVLSNLGIKGKGRQSKNEKLRDKEWMKDQYYTQKRSVRDIAIEIGSTCGAVYSSLRFLGIKFRSVNAGLRLKYPGGRFGKNASNWRGGRKTAGKKYIALYSPDHPNCTAEGYVMEHRLVMEKSIGRYLTKKEIVHHKNGDKKDNRIENLELLASKGEHTRHHYAESAETDRLRKLLVNNGIDPDIDKVVAVNI